MNTLKSNNTFSNFTDEELVEKIVLTKNTALFSVTQNDALNQSYLNVIQVAQETGYALLLYVPYENVGLSLEKDITLWLKYFSVDWKTNYNIKNNDLSILTSLLLQKNWSGNLKVKVQLDTIANNEDLLLLNDLVRFPVSTIIEPYKPEEELTLFKKVGTDLNIIGLPSDKSIQDLLDLVNLSRTSALYCLDSESENALV